MKFSFTTVIFVVLVLTFSVFIANISNLIAVEVENTLHSQYGTDTEKQENFNNHSRLRRKKENLIINDGFEHLMWFLQVIARRRSISIFLSVVSLSACFHGLNSVDFRYPR